jgi:hypothetical protein
MRKKNMLLATPVIIALIFVSYFALTHFDISSKSASSVLLSPPNTSPYVAPMTASPSIVSITDTPLPTFAPPNSTKSFVRNANTSEEKTALQFAENFDYATASNTILYGDKYANFIDITVLNHYSELVDSSKEGINLDYQANASTWSQAKVTLTSSSIQVSGLTKGTVSVIESGWGTATFAYINASQYQLVKSGTVTIDLPLCYVVKMDLTASEIFGPTNGFWNTINQIVVLDDNFKPIAFGTRSQQVFS